MFDLRRHKNIITIMAGFVLLFTGVFLVLDDLVFHWIGYVGPVTGTLLDDTVLEHGVYGAVMAVIGLLLIKLA